MGYTFTLIQIPGIIILMMNVKGNEMAIFVMTTANGCPVSCYEFEDRGDGNYPWAHHGYIRMEATNDADAVRELMAARDEFWRALYSE